MRTIIHFDLDAFYCAVEELAAPTLVGVPFAVGGAADSRGVVASCSYAARLYGVRSAMPMRTAKRLCSDLIIVRANFEAYADMSRAVMQYLHDRTPLVEPLSIDEAFLDMTGVPGTAADIARDIQRQIDEALGLPCSLGVATNKLVAKIANNQGKGRHRTGKPPRAIEVVPPGQEAAYLAPLPIRELWGVGPRTAEQLEDLGIHTIGDIAAQSTQFMMHHFGKHGYDMQHRARGIDSRPVDPARETKSISKETTFATDVQDRETLLRTLRNLVEQVGRRVRRHGYSGKTINIKLRWADFTTLTRQTTLETATRDDAIISQTAENLFNAHWPANKPVRLIGVGISNLEESARQAPLWEPESHKKQRKLQTTLDELREKFGDQSVQRGINIAPPDATD